MTSAMPHELMTASLNMRVFLKLILKTFITSDAEPAALILFTTRGKHGDLPRRVLRVLELECLASLRGGNVFSSHLQGGNMVNPPATHDAKEQGHDAL